MTLNRKFSTRTGWLNFPPGVSPADSKGVSFAEDAIKNLLDADDVKVSFDTNNQGQPLLHRMNVEVHNHPKQGQFINTAGIESDTAKILGDLIEDLAEGKDPKKNLDALESQVGDSEGEDKDVPSDKDELSEEPLIDEPDPVPGANLDKKTPFASRRRRANNNKGRNGSGNSNGSEGTPKKKSVMKRAMNLEREYSIPLTEGVKIVRNIDRASDFKQAMNYMSKEILNESDEKLPMDDYVRIAELAKGEKRDGTPLL